MILLSSPNRDDRPDDALITTLVLHYTGMKTAEEAIDRLCDRAAQVSAHYVVDEAGQVYRLVEEADRAWHAGKSHWRGRDRINDVSIGIEIVNPGHEFGYRPFPEAQMAAVEALCVDIVARHAIAPRNVVGHSDIAPERKVDPGELFDWQRLARAGVGLWPVAVDVPEILLREGDHGETVYILQRMLSEYGYLVGSDGRFDAAFTQVVEAFQRHFRPQKIDGVWDRACQGILIALSRS
jgi:N-acetylmuramoyl-L-alanine amidase